MFKLVFEVVEGYCDVSRLRYCSDCHHNEQVMCGHYSANRTVLSDGCKHAKTKRTYIGRDVDSFEFMPRDGISGAGTLSVGEDVYDVSFLAVDGKQIGIYAAVEKRPMP